MRESSWEYSGKTVDEAVTTALEELGLEREDIHVEVLEKPQKGLFGIGGKEARVLVELIGEWEVLGAAGEEKPMGDEGESGEHLREEAETEEKEAALPGEVLMPEKVVREILSLVGIDANVEARESEESFVVDVWGDDVAVLIGKNGATLEALQFLVNIGCRRTGGVEKRIVVDVEGYRKRRKGRLEKQAEELARKVSETGKSVEMPPMTASERKIIHMFLRDNRGVTTESIGEEPERRVVIFSDSGPPPQERP